MMMSAIRSGLRRLGYDVSKYTITSNSHARLRNYLKQLKIDLVLDVGANTGQSGAELRGTLGYRGVIHSFEPLAEAFAALQAAAARDPRWTAHHCALGQRTGRATIHVAGNSQSSSLLPMTERHSSAAPGSQISSREEIETRRLDEVLPEIRAEIRDGAQRLYLKCDTQGFELEVLRGAGAALAEISLVRLELSTEDLYSGAPLIGEVIAFMYDHGFALADIKAGFADPQTGQMLQCDGLFLNKMRA